MSLRNKIEDEIALFMDYLTVDLRATRVGPMAVICVFLQSGSKSPLRKSAVMIFLRI